MKAKKLIAMMLAAATAVSMLASCGEKGGTVDGKINLQVGRWPDETQENNYATMNKRRDDFMAANPDINIIPDTFSYDEKMFTLKASAGQMPNLFGPWFTEIKKLIRSGYIADITEYIEKYGFDKAMNPSLLELASGPDGKIYGIPMSVYAQGLYINKKLFKEAGLVNSDGSIKVPQTYDEVAQFAQQIKEKTGKAGLVLPTTNNAGGWQFINIAWSNGVEFLKQKDDGTYEAIFDTQEMRNALQYVKDLKWKHDALVADTLVARPDTFKYFGTYQAGMMIADPPCNTLTTSYGMNIDDIMVVKMPAGPAGRFAQTGGDIWMFSSNSTPEQIDAGFKWLMFTGLSPELTEEKIENAKASYRNTLENGGIVLDKESFPIWVGEEREKIAGEMRAEFTNVKPENYEQYYDFTGVTIKPEPEQCAQQLYAVLDKCIQEVITNKDADIDSLVKEAVKDFQLNHLDKEN